MDREQEKKLAEDMQREMRDDGAWEAASEPVAPRRDTLASQVTLRLEPEHATKLRRIAQQAGVGYTSLLRRWILERLDSEDRAVIGEGRLQWTSGSAGTKEFTYQTASSRIAVEAA